MSNYFPIPDEGMKQRTADTRYPEDGMTASAVKKSPIEIGLNEVHNQVEQLMDAVHTLYERISPALVPEPTEGESTAGNPEPLCSPVAAQLRELTRRILRLRRQIESITNRVEL